MQFGKLHQNRDRISHVKQVKKETRLEFTDKITPYENHILFEVNLKTETISLAEFEKSSADIHWNDAVRGNFVRKRKVVKKPNCIYISSLNEANCRKILARDYKLDAEKFTIV